MNWELSNSKTDMMLRGVKLQDDVKWECRRHSPSAVTG